ncbi:hypothetical protein BJ508DRAFT_415221 [Ascobolus immersus RN42]|uniref:Mediator of RNA polymerase II transcription subunit 11 n=1 Tax=Ascobolus immersus RN42 TaxID=1160509 RepID=A0A3N4I3R7_ASCIM|nr:hypothetical protein BJ508DRAFT_415221 [Ascobolus immersus RN42]
MSFPTSGGPNFPPPPFTNPDPGPPPNVSERIASLSRIDEQISTLLLTASTCVQSLAPPSGPPNGSQPSFAERRAQFIHAAEEYQRLITRITNGLQKEVIELTNAQLWAGVGSEGGVEVGMEGTVWKEGREWVEKLKEGKEGKEEGSQ